VCVCEKEKEVKMKIERNEAYFVRRAITLLQSLFQNVTRGSECKHQEEKECKRRLLGITTDALGRELDQLNKFSLR